MKKSVLYSLLVVSIFFCTKLHAQSFTPSQIKQIEEIAQTIAAQHNANSQALQDDMTVSSHAIAVSRNVRFTNVLTQLFAIDYQTPLKRRVSIRGENKLIVISVG